MFTPIGMGLKPMPSTGNQEMNLDLLYIILNNGDCFEIINPSCYLTRKLMLQARTKRATLVSKPLAVTA
jgi:hypothetical protein